MDRMSPQDASFLHVEDDINHMHIASVAIFEGPPPPYEDIVAMVASKLPQVPRYRQKVRFVPFDLGRPLWVDDPHFNIQYHIRHTAMPAPGDDEALRNLVGRVMSQQLDRNKPLWEMWMAEGLSDNRWALLSKTHHCMVDGVSGTDLLTVVLDQEREPVREPEQEWNPEPAPTGFRLIADALGERAVSPYETIRSVRSATRMPRQLASQAIDIGRGARSLVGLARPVPETSLNGPIGPHRTYAWARTTLDDVKVVRGAFGGTVNDVVLTVITRGFRELLLHRGEPVDDRVVRTLVPVSIRTPGERGTYNNRVSAMFASLPIGIRDPRERLQAIRTQMEGLKASKQAVAAEALMSMSGFAPPLLLALGTRVATRAMGRVGQRNINTVTTNVPGPRFPLYAAGRQLLEAFPYVPLAGSVRTGIAIFSYMGQLNYGVTGDWDWAPDVGVLARGIEDGMDELLTEAKNAG